MGTFWQDLKSTVKKTVDVAVEKTDEYTKIGKIKVEILSLEKKTDKAFRELGETAYAMLKKSSTAAVGGNPEIQKLAGTIDGLKKSIKSKESEVEKIKKEAAARSAAAKAKQAPEKGKEAEKPAARKKSSSAKKTNPDAARKEQ